jgi:hypothetical protein
MYNQGYEVKSAFLLFVHRRALSSAANALYSLAVHAGRLAAASAPLPICRTLQQAVGHSPASRQSTRYAELYSIHAVYRWLQRLSVITVTVTWTSSLHSDTAFLGQTNAEAACCRADC